MRLLETVIYTVFGIRWVLLTIQFSSVQSLSYVRLFVTPWTHSTPGLPVHHQFPEPTQTHVHWAVNAIQPSYPLSSPSPPALNLSQHQGLYQWVDCLYWIVFGCTRWPEYWSFSFSISPSNEYSGLISFRIDWFDLFTVQGTLKNLFKASQFKSINFLALSLLYGPPLTSVHDLLEKPRLWLYGLCRQSDVSAL